MPDKPALDGTEQRRQAKATNLVMGESSRERRLAPLGGKPWNAAG
jgi:hypothetical protein